MKLSKRLQAIYDLVDEKAIVGDIGCDHALLSCALVLNEKASKVYACDINEEPLQQARKSIQYYKLEDQIEIIQCDGLDMLPSDVDTIVIAGMGYETIKSILDKHPEKLKGCNKIIIQSNRDVEKIRKYVSDHHYHIQSEQCVFDLHYYQIIVFDCSNDSELNKKELLFGRRMIKDNVFLQMWFSNLKKYESILGKLSEKNEKYQIIYDIINQIKEEIEV
ncbi:tRNA (adenine22-N1)-methyltransferase [Breznakia sp. PF5-3]|uniref:tRNA (adenine(22)-N(1))-methyltransferase n=1 Tax=unclassified Breznakia TaxID=2623764 RepID=UPI002407700D|nr:MULTISPECIES: class I SAM-dependent methyltransferase [unclassified Breznakia]MDF9824434.1 tRNA (adenine22-N1)-methyltransferase [Breznakia sp. PM6-1]MDF9835163.1 tRNA (adenine22-N1)-methyltransferase [Breznakia sp. PF5-3]MDF9838312.1 tRNA (adenine22-N1)-methyltransferase [Breznakia sp. PFB2-8]MDF9860328.1 tRNA (adenine22-N1)-methyltransferase [Breznakia sp. PH5-24]